MLYSKQSRGFYVDNCPFNDAVEISENEYTLLLQGQSLGKIITADEAGYPILIDPPLATASQVWEAIKVERDRRTQTGGYKVGDKWFHSDTFSRFQQIGLYMMGASMPSGIEWKTMDGTKVAMTPVLAADIFQAAAASDQAIFTAAEVHKISMESSADPSSYDFTNGWPLIFGE